MTHDQSEALPKSRQSRVISMEFPRSFLPDVNSRGNQCWRRGMSAVSSDYTATPTNGHQNATRRELTNVKTEGAFLPSEDLKVLPGRKISCLYIATNRLQKH